MTDVNEPGDHPGGVGLTPPPTDHLSHHHDSHHDSIDDLDPEEYGRSGKPGERATPGHPYIRPARLGIFVGVFAALAAWRGLPIMVVVLAVVVMIFFHELGHYVMARRAGMKVTEFMIGFGPRIFSFRRGDVEYGIKAIPAGAYVKIIGMANIEEVPPADEAQTYRQKGYWARMGVAVAGSTMHFIMALCLITLSFIFVGRTSESQWAVRTVAADSAADLAGVRLGDRVVSVDGVAVSSFDEMASEAKKRPGKTVPVVVERDGRTVTLQADITPRFFVFGTIGEAFQVYGNGDGGLSVSLTSGSALAKEGLRDGDAIRAINGTPVATVAEARTVLSSSEVAKSGDVALSVVHAKTGKSATVDVDLGSELGIDSTVGFFGVGSKLIPEKLSPVSAVPAAFSWFGTMTSQSVTGIGKFFAPSNLADFAQRTFSTAPGETHDIGKPKANQTVLQQTRERDGGRIVSIVGAVLLGEELTTGGWGQLLAFLALLNIAIGILNLIPLPPFDGGHVAIGTYEKLRELLRRDGRRYFADYNKVMPLAIAVIGFMMIVGLMATYLDLADPIRL